MGRAFGDFSISKNEKHAFSRAHVIPALKSYRAPIKKDSRLHPIESLQLQPLQKSIQQVGVRTSNSNRVALLKQLPRCLLKTHTQTHPLSGTLFVCLLGSIVRKMNLAHREAARHKELILPDLSQVAKVNALLHMES